MQTGALVLPPAGLDPSTLVAVLLVDDSNWNQTYTATFDSGAGDTHNSLFIITNSRELRLRSLLRPTLATPLSLRVRATDNGVPQLSTVAVLSISLNQAPTNISNVYEYDPTAAPGTVLGNFVITGDTFTDVPCWCRSRVSLL